MKNRFLFQHSRNEPVHASSTQCSGVDAAVHGGAEEADSDSEDEATDDVEPPKVLGYLLESLAGAVFMDSGMNLQAVWDTLGVLFTEKIGMWLDTEKVI